MGIGFRSLFSAAAYDLLTHADCLTQTARHHHAERISFQLANNRGRYTHFVHHDGTVASLYPMETLFEARVGIICEEDFSTEGRYDVIDEFASLAVGVKSTIGHRLQLPLRS